MVQDHLLNMKLTILSIEAAGILQEQNRIIQIRPKEYHVFEEFYISGK